MVLLALIRQLCDLEERTQSWTVERRLELRHRSIPCNAYNPLQMPAACSHILRASDPWHS